MAPAPHLNPDALLTLRETVAARVERAELPGAVTLVARVGHDGSEQVEVGVFGETGLGSGRPMRRDTPSASPR